MKKELSNMDIALFALYKLGGVTKGIHTEKIAWEAYTLAKERFSWRLSEFRKKELPDKTPVRFALEQAKKKEHGKLVTGRAGGDIGRPELEGWRFTPQGAEWIRKNESRIASALNQRKPDLPKRDAEKFVRKLKTDPCFKHFQEKGNLEDTSKYMFIDMLGCAPDASKDILKKKFDLLLTTAKLVRDIEVIKFLEACSSTFSSLLTTN